MRTFELENTEELANGNRYDPLENLVRACELFVDWAQYADASDPSAFDAVAGQMHTINYFISEAYRSGCEREEILAIIHAVRAVQGTSPFVRRLQTWPRGYQGDFETVEYLMEGVNRAEPCTAAFWIEKYCLNTGVAQQHRNKVRWQADHIERTIAACERSDRHARILLLACGSSPDVRQCLDQIKNKKFSIVLNDMDHEALEFSCRNLDVLGDRVKAIGGNMFRQINKFAAEGPFDLVLAGGLFDYLKDEQAEFLINAAVFKLLVPNGRFVFTNISKPNPYKIWMEHCANWTLIERDEDEIRQLLHATGIRSENTTICRETTGLTNLIEIEK